MAIYHMSMKPVRRSAGHSTVAAAAYRSGTRMRDERSGVLYDYTRKERVLLSNIITPSGSTINRSDLWNTVEQHHKRCDATVGYSFEASLPYELSDAENFKIAYDFSKAISERWGVAVDYSIHRGKVQNNIQGDMLHVHFGITSCKYEANDSLGKKVNELDPIWCARNGIEKSADVVRPAWEQHINTALEANHINERVDHRSHEERGIRDQPTIHVGRGMLAYHRTEYNESIKQANAERQERLRVEREEIRAHLVELQRKTDEAEAKSQAIAATEREAQQRKREATLAELKQAEAERKARLVVARESPPAQQTQHEAAPVVQIPTPEVVVKPTTPAPRIERVGVPVAPTPAPIKAAEPQMQEAPRRGPGTPNWDEWYRVGRTTRSARWTTEHPDPPTPEQWGALSAGAIDRYMVETMHRDPLYDETPKGVVPRDPKTEIWIPESSKAPPGITLGDPRWNDWYIQGRQGNSYTLPSEAPTKEQWQALGLGMQDKERERHGQPTLYQVVGRIAVIATESEFVYVATDLTGKGDYRFASGAGMTAFSTEADAKAFCQLEHKQRGYSELSRDELKGYIECQGGRPQTREAVRGPGGVGRRKLDDPYVRPEGNVPTKWFIEGESLGLDEKTTRGRNQDDGWSLG